MTTTVHLETYSDADFSLTMDSPIHPTRIGTGLLHMHVRVFADDNTVWLDATSANGMISSVAGVGPTADTISLLIPQAKLLNLPPGNYVHSLILSNLPFGIRTEIWRGTLVHAAGPTRWTAGTP